MIFCELNLLLSFEWEPCQQVFGCTTVRMSVRLIVCVVCVRQAFTGSYLGAAQRQVVCDHQCRRLPGCCSQFWWQQVDI